MSHGAKIARSAGVVAGATLVSRILGYLRDMIVAFALGASMSADAFFVAFRIPNLLRRLFGEGSLTMAMIPVYSRIREEQGQEAADATARSALMWLALILGVITVIVELAAGPVTSLIAPGFRDTPELFDLTTKLLRICFPYIILISGVALCMGVLNAGDRFLAPALAPTLLNLSLIAAALIAYWQGWNVAESLAWGVLVGGVAQWLLQQPFLASIGFSWRGPRSWRDPGVRRIGLLMLPTVFGAAVYQLNILLGTVLASFLPAGSVSYLYYADRLVQFPLGVFGIAVSTAALPSLSRLAAQKKDAEFSSTLRMALGLTLFICLPSMAGLLALGEPIINLLFGRGAFSDQAVQATGAALWAYAWGLPFIALSRPLVAAFYAREDTKTPVLVAVVSLAVNIGLGAYLMQSYGHVGLALGLTAASVCNFTLLWGLLTRRAGTVLPVVSILKSGALCVGVYYAARWSGGLGLWWLALIPVWAVLYFVGAGLLRMDEARLFIDAFRRKLSRRRQARAQQTAGNEGSGKKASGDQNTGDQNTGNQSAGDQTAGDPARDTTTGGQD